VRETVITDTIGHGRTVTAGLNVRFASNELDGSIQRVASRLSHRADQLLQLALLLLTGIPFLILLEGKTRTFLPQLGLRAQSAEDALVQEILFLLDLFLLNLAADLIRFLGSYKIKKYCSLKVN